MWTTMFMAAALGLAQVQPTGQLALTNARVTHGAMGALRSEGPVLPGDSIYITFDIEGITPDSAGKVLYGMGTEVLDANGKPFCEVRATRSGVKLS